MGSEILYKSVNTDVLQMRHCFHLLFKQHANLLFGIIEKSFLFYLNFHVLFSVGILQAQGLLTQLPQPSQANLLPTQPSINLATQVSNDASTYFKILSKYL